MSRISADTKKKIVSMLVHGARGYEIAEATGVSTRTVTKIRKELQDDGYQIWHTHGGVVASSMY